MKPIRALKISVNKATDLANLTRVALQQLESNLNFQGFGDFPPSIFFYNEDDGTYSLVLSYQDVLFRMSDIVEAYGKYGKITKNILNEIILNS